ncbi:Uncharacterised protein [Anaerostipes hadrus]|uniref:Uncharacterized protein n=1 Tax=Anaerostipes hadrus TaxID=649756 RepID=A0A174JHH9_ANAHA|nr:hypothetical protein [Anaerostipes hadrus]CUO99162.1 Uncharacterised protein [Anaerostipes hadrus]
MIILNIIMKFLGIIMILYCLYWFWDTRDFLIPINAIGIIDIIEYYCGISWNLLIFITGSVLIGFKNQILYSRIIIFSSLGIILSSIGMIISATIDIWCMMEYIIERKEEKNKNVK